MKYVTILNEGRIPWTSMVGPVFGYPISDGLYSFLRKTSVQIKLTTPDEAKKEKEAYFESKQKKEDTKNQPTENINISDNILITPVVDKTPEDDEIDSILADAPAQQAFPDSSTAILCVPAQEEPIEDKPTIIKYSKKTLETMTKAELKQILKDRKVTGKYAGHYHDTHPVLVEKVLKSQEEGK